MSNQIEKLKVAVPKSKFEEHLQNDLNKNILFSAPFGQGKTTFLNYFFDERKEQFEVFKVFPVNYSIASNEDIFRYIKTDILIQLLEKNAAFNYSENGFQAMLGQEFLLNPTQSLRSLIKFSLGLNSKTKSIVSIIETYEKLLIKNDNQDDKKPAIKYIEEMYNKEGSIFEDNFFTQLIRQLVDIIKKGKSPVLVIDDLDRMDPEHIFRILNVISAHCDSFEMDEKEYSNKFGFDKIILVCDLDNIQYIFGHRYGQKVNFTGYINKFYSTSPFKFDNKEEMLVLIDKLYSSQHDVYGTMSTSYTIKLIFGSLILADQLSLRDIICLKKININPQNLGSYLWDNELKSSFDFAKGLFTPIIHILYQLASKEIIIAKINKCKQLKINYLKFNHLENFKYLLAGLSNWDGYNKPTDIIYKDYKITCKFGFDRLDYKYLVFEKIFDKNNELINIEDVLFSLDDLYDLLIKNIEKYDSLIKTKAQNERR
jgi:hypothetical protein